MSGHRTPFELYQSPLAQRPYRATTGTLVVDRQGCVIPVNTAAGAASLTLARPTKEGIVGSVVLIVDGGDLTLTVTGGYNADGDTSITLADAGDFVTFMSFKIGSAYYWRVLAQEGTNAAMEDLAVDQLTATTATVTTLNAPTVSAEHGAGFIGTAAAPVTSRRTENGTIVTEFKFDLTGLRSKNTQDTVIGLAAGGAAYMGRNVVATNGIIYKMELVCLETPAGGDNDLSVYQGSAATNAYNNAVTNGAEKINGGDQVAGMVTVVTAPALTANYYYYLVAGTGDTDAAYTAGMFILRTYGHALLA